MLGRSKFALRQGFAWGKTLVRRKSAADQKAGICIPENIQIGVACNAVVDVNRPRRRFFVKRKPRAEPVVAKGFSYAKGKYPPLV